MKNMEELSRKELFNLIIIIILFLFLMYNGYLSLKEKHDASNITKSLVNIHNGKPIEDRNEFAEVKTQIERQNIANNELIYVTFLDIANYYDVIELPNDANFNDELKNDLKPIATIKNTIEKNKSPLVFTKGIADDTALYGHTGIETNTNRYLLLNEDDWSQLKNQNVNIQEDKIYAKVYKSSKIEYRIYYRNDLKPEDTNKNKITLSEHIKTLPSYEIANNEIVKR